MCIRDSSDSDTVLPVDAGAGDAAVVVAYHLCCQHMHHRVYPRMIGRNSIYVSSY